MSEAATDGGGPGGAGVGRARPSPSRRLITALGPAVAIVLVQQVVFPAPSGIVLRGVIVGGLTALIALGMALVHRSDRIINFAQADLGFAPAVLAYLLIDEVGMPWPVAVVAGLVAAIALGGATERLVIRRFSRSPRLLVTIATIGLSQVLTAVALLVPRLWGRRLVSDRIDPPFEVTVRLGGVVFDANDLLALVLTPLVVVAVATLLRRSAAGVAIRASADDGDRAALLGVPVHRLRTIVWATAAGLAFVTVFLRGGILGLPADSVLGFSVLLRALVALVIGRMTNLVTVTTAAVALGVLELGIAWDHSVALVDPVLGVIVVVALLLQRGGTSGDGAGDDTAWRAADEVRGVPSALAHLPVVRWGRRLALVTVVAAAAVVPHVVSVDRSLRASALLVYALLGLSLVVLSGWGGHVSLGQVAFFAIGAAVCGWVTGTHGADLVAGLVVASLAGAAAAVVVGVPASRVRGLTLAVTTFAFSLATTSYLLDRNRFEWVPSGRVERAPLLGGFEVATPTEVYGLVLAVLVIVGLGVRGIRTSRAGRAMVALRDNDRAAQSYGIRPATLRVATFALSGGIAALAGGLFIHHQQAFDATTYAPVQNLAVFTMVVIGGLTSVTGAVLGAGFLLGAQWFLPAELRVLASGVGVLLVLWLVPGGLATLPFAGRDALLRRLAARHGTTVGPVAEDDVTPSDGAPLRGEDDRGEVPTTAGLLAVEGLDVSYGPVQILFGVDVIVEEGEAVALLGTNGAGKSTLLRAVSGVVPTTAGTVVLDGRDITRLPAHARVALGMAQVPGGSGVFPSLTVAENLRVAGWLHRRRPGDLEEARTQVDELFPVLTGRAGQRAGSLSGGEQQMLGLAMALLTRPRLLLIDELSLGLAPEVVGRLLRALEQLRRESMTVLLVEQSVEVALAATDRAMFLERGQVRFSGPTDELAQRPDLLRSVFLGGATSVIGAGPGAADASTPAGVMTVPAEATVDTAATVDTSDLTPAGDATPALEGVRLSRSFEGVAAVRSVSFEVGPGEVLGIIGPNGAGKTTVFDLVSGFTTPDGGSVRLGGRDVSRWSPSARARGGLGRSFQDARLFPSLSVEEAVATACERWVAVRDPLSAAFRLPNALDSERAVSRRVAELVELLGLGDHRSSFVGELSTGTRRVVDLACLLAHQPSVVLLDEPAAGIAQREVEALAPLIRRVRDETGASLVVIEHDISLIEAVADRLVAMDQGRVIAVGRPDAVLGDPVVVESYLGTEEAAIRRSGAPSGG
ncbi:MAG TPA: ATP-binding cassette domain-containing protein [Acidimicrobiales bacterium]|nr:ATP-binding cassette domain-containing protein [Acidimicrobiales bacterium]